jgi:LysR family nitrogen assimilation transcriptional regulator
MRWAYLKIFVQVAELSSFSKAAAALGTTQPTVSRSIVELEEQFGGALFYRTGRGVTLTERGSMLLPRARLLVQEGEQLTTDALAYGQSPAGRVSIAALPSVMHSVAARLYMALQESAPNIRLRLVEAFSDQVESWLAQGDIDIGLLCRYRPVTSERDEVLLSENLLLLRTRSAPSLPDDLPFDELAGLPLVLPSTPNGLRLAVEETARRRKIPLMVTLEADSLSTQKDIVRECGCYAVVAAQATHYDTERQFFASSRIIDPELQRMVIMKATTQRPLNRATRKVIETIRHIFVGTA